MNSVSQAIHVLYILIMVDSLINLLARTLSYRPSPSTLNVYIEESKEGEGGEGEGGEDREAREGSPLSE